jgi:parallel beta-helix repeat protein
VVWEGKDWDDPQQRITLGAAEGARPVIEGADPMPGPWERAEVALAQPPAKPPAVFSCSWGPYASMVFVDGGPLKQIGLQGNPARAQSRNGFQYQKQWDGKTLADLRPGSFFFDAEAKRLYLWLADGSDPATHTVEAAVRDQGLTLRGTWTVRGLEVRHVRDGFWPHEQAGAVTGRQCLIENCRFVHNEFLGLIAQGEDGIVRNCELAYNGLEGMTGNYGFRMLLEGNEFHHNGWRGDVVCLTFGNKWVQWREGRFLRNHFHDEPATALWLDINVQNVLVAENRFENCACGVYFEISRWGVIANNIFRNCGRAIWVYGADALVAHNVVDRCGEGITISGYPRTATYVQSVLETPYRDCLMAVRNNLAVNNLLIDCAGAFVGITEPTAFGWNNWSDYNAFVWTLPAFHPCGMHINCMSGWDTLYGKLPIWRLERHCDGRTVLADPGQLANLRAGSPWVGLAEGEVFDEAGIADREAGDYRLREDSPLRNRGLTLPLELNAPYHPGKGNEILSRAWAATLVSDAPEPASATPVYQPAGGHYRLQPLPHTRPLVDLAACKPGTPGLNAEWQASGSYPRFRSDQPDELAAPDAWLVLPDNLVQDSSFRQPFGKDGETPAKPWTARGGLHVSGNMACANLAPDPAASAVAFQKLDPARPGETYVLYADMHVVAADAVLATVGEAGLALGADLRPVGEGITVRAAPGATRPWAGAAVEVRLGPDVPAGQDLFLVLRGRVEGTGGSANPAGFVRWDDVFVLKGPPPEG